MTKTCYSCHLEKDIEEFNWKNRSKGIRQGYCRECKKNYQKKYYNASKESYLKTILTTRKARKQEAVQKARLYLLEHPCVDCGNTDIRVLHFDHVRGEKYNDVTHMIQRGNSWALISEEIAKCEIRCANCHMIRTWPNRWKVDGPIV